MQLKNWKRLYKGILKMQKYTSTLVMLTVKQNQVNPVDWPTRIIKKQ